MKNPDYRRCQDAAARVWMNRGGEASLPPSPPEFDLPPMEGTDRHGRAWRLHYTPPVQWRVERETESGWKMEFQCGYHGLRSWCREMCEQGDADMVRGWGYRPSFRFHEQILRLRPACRLVGTASTRHETYIWGGNTGWWRTRIWAEPNHRGGIFMWCRSIEKFRGVQETKMLVSDCQSMHAAGIVSREAGDATWLEKEVLEQMFADMGRPSWADVIRSYSGAGR